MHVNLLGEIPQVVFMPKKKQKNWKKCEDFVIYSRHFFLSSDWGAEWKNIPRNRNVTHNKRAAWNYANEFKKREKNRKQTKQRGDRSADWRHNLTKIPYWFLMLSLCAVNVTTSRSRHAQHPIVATNIIEYIISMVFSLYKVYKRVVNKIIIASIAYWCQLIYDIRIE